MDIESFSEMQKLNCCGLRFAPASALALFVRLLAVAAVSIGHSSSQEGMENFTEMQVNSHKIYLPASEVFQRLYVRLLRIKFLLLLVFLYPNSKRLYEIRLRDNALSKIFITALSDKADINKKTD